MRILVVHNRYRQPGGEDAVFAAEVALLRDAGHTVATIEFSNDDIADGSLRGKARTAVTATWSRDGARRVAAAARAVRADVAHFHNTFPLVSPAAYRAARREGAAIVQSLHNFRLICPNALLFRDGHPCNDCVGHRVPFPAIAHACYRGSRVETAAVAAMLAVHNFRDTWTRDIDRFIALTDASRAQFIAGGLPAERIVVKPNFVADPGLTFPPLSRSGFLYAGRLERGKGVSTLLEALALQPTIERVRFAGDGPLSADVAAHAGAEGLGWLARPGLFAAMASSRAVVFPSLYHENFPVTFAEAFATGTPVIASAQGASAEIVQDQRTGLLVPAGDASALATTMLWAQTHEREVTRMGETARRTYVDRYTPTANLARLTAIYDSAISVASGRLA